MTKTITRVYDSYTEAENVVRQLEAAGLPDSSIGIVASNADGWHKPEGSNVDPKHDKARHGNDDRVTGAATGGGLGAVAGGAAGVLAGLGMLAIPGIGPVVAAGWLAAAATGAVAGGATGGIVGALAGSGTSKENAELYAEALRRGGAIVTARVPDEQETRYSAIMNRAAIDMARRAEMYRSSGWKGYDPAAPAYTAEQVRRERETYR
ncbi:MAG TPA: hypothetical protein VHT03_06160 [Rhizomicrobium sp.]|jgi:hypothetical protein|nr:hypothetical protein [Rhizomicrobium sp.]